MQGSSDIIDFNRKDKYFSGNVFTAPGYEQRYEKFLKAIAPEIDPEKLPGAKIYDIGCGAGGTGLRFAALGADVTFLDGREENLAAVREKSPSAKTHIFNVEADLPIKLPQVDLVLCMGLIYHTGDPLSVLKRVSAYADNIVVETTSLDHDGKAIIYMYEDSAPRQFSVTGRACRVSPKWVEEALLECGFKWIKDLNSPETNVAPGDGYPGCLYDWKFERTCGWRRNECVLKKLYIASRDPTSSIFLTH